MAPLCVLTLRAWPEHLTIFEGLFDSEQNPGAKFLTFLSHDLLTPPQDIISKTVTPADAYRGLDLCLALPRLNSFSSHDHLMS